jgi:hypothetical protein
LECGDALIENARATAVNRHSEAASDAPPEAHEIAVVNLDANTVSSSGLAGLSACRTDPAVAVGHHLVGQDAIIRAAAAVVTGKWIIG